VIAITIALAGLAPRTVSATLGGDVSTIQTDRARMLGAQRQIVRTDAFTTHEMQSSTGIVVREFVNGGGTVFGVAWQGASFPDMRQLLGPYFDRYQQEVARITQERRGHGPLTVDLGDVVVQTSGHARAFAGRAYVRAMMPQGIAIDAIR